MRLPLLCAILLAAAALACEHDASKCRDNGNDCCAAAGGLFGNLEPPACADGYTVLDNQGSCFVIAERYKCCRPGTEFSAIGGIIAGAVVGVVCLTVCVVVACIYMARSNQHRATHPQVQVHTAQPQPQVSTGGGVVMQAQPVAMQAQPVAMQAQPVAMQAQPQLQTVQVAIPAGVAPGAQFMVQVPSGKQVAVQCPPGVGPGQLLQVQVPM